MERGRGRATYTEVEKSAADLRRAQTWLASIRARDYFDADGYQDAAAVERCEEALAAFEREALANELAEPHGALEDKPRRLRAVAPEDDAVTETRRLSALPHPARMDECSERTVRRGGPAGTQGGQRLEKAAMVCVHSPYIRRGENK